MTTDTLALLFDGDAAARSRFVAIASESGPVIGADSGADALARAFSAEALAEELRPFVRVAAAVEDS